MSDRVCPPTSGPVSTTQPVDTEVRVKEEELLTLPSPTAGTSVAQTEADPDVPSPSQNKVRRTQARRRALLRDDPQVQEVEPQRVLCRNCKKWIRLSGISDYCLTNWRGHKHRCHSSTPTRSIRRTPSKPNFSPGSRVATAERKIVLLNDRQVKACSPRHVQCGTCNSMVALEGEVEFDLTKWTEHKEKCIPMTPAPITPQGSTSHRPAAFPPSSTSSTHSQVVAGASPRTPTSVGESSNSHSTETTVVTEASPAAVKVGAKRGREEEMEDGEEVAKDVDERPMNRPRTDTYKPAQEEAPNVFGWFMQPLKEFARGFREGLGST